EPPARAGRCPTLRAGPIYLPRPGDLPDERRVLTIGTGAYRPGRRLGERVEHDFFDLKGALKELLDRLGIVNRDWEPIRHVSFAPGRAATLSVSAAGPYLARRGAT